MEVVGERENRCVQGRHQSGEGAPSPIACLLTHPFFLVPTTSKSLLRDVNSLKDTNVHYGQGCQK